jgi:hypothetical protein
MKRLLEYVLAHGFVRLLIELALLGLLAACNIAVEIGGTYGTLR